VYNGLGGIAGALVGGYLYAEFGAHMLFAIAAIIAVLGVVLLALSTYRTRHNRAAHAVARDRNGVSADVISPASVVEDPNQVAPTPGNTIQSSPATNPTTVLFSDRHSCLQEEEKLRLYLTTRFENFTGSHGPHTATTA
jgi:MFS family permease